MQSAGWVGSPLILRSPFGGVLAISLFGLAWLQSVAFRNVGMWLIREDPLAHADVIVVLGGGIGGRAERAASIFRMGYAPEIWISHPDSPAAEIAKLGIHYRGEESYNREVVIKEGVPEMDVRIFPDVVVNTEQEVREIARLMRREHKRCAIVVTSPQHTRRVHALWQKIVGQDPRIIVRAAWEDPFDSKHWWRKSDDTLSVIRELLGILNLWFGLPVRPRMSSSSVSDMIRTKPMHFSAHKAAGYVAFGLPARDRLDVAESPPLQNDHFRGRREIDDRAESFVKVRDCDLVHASSLR